ncbi:putative phosphatidylcholine-hydrolyzing phospholipase c protein [Daldinia childiae]|uniref:putative phosphatidylcholine-hydrolyzing phospholipase c protein n=1 Tax=Daldinia childiae TaxID=326645 RepID=UPI00144809F0|nr:putative phosphatidylcholine-hydrolyzing phospholipase c protein [Daldinia childiae]KAF3068350.1 putative phosphatidylcholine-hydrolyzing phospholipase c protein [Daldinia childiae]
MSLISNSDYPITINGTSIALSSSDVAAVATGPLKYNVYHQDSNGAIREHTYNGEWSATKSPTFSAKLSSPLAVISFDDGKEVRVYCVSKARYLEEWCLSAGQNEWVFGYLTNSRFRVGDNTRLAAVYCGDGDIRVYAQGNLKTDKMLPHTSITAVAWYNSAAYILVYCQDDKSNIVTYKWDHGWSSDVIVTGRPEPGKRISALKWGDESVKLYYQADDDKIYEHVQSNGKV